MTMNTIQKKATQGDPQAQFEWATNLNNTGQGIQALEWFEKAANQDHAEAALTMAFASAQGQLIAENPKAAINYLQRAVACDHAFATQALASAKIEGFGSQCDWPGAMDLLCARAKKGEPQFLRQVGVFKAAVYKPDIFSAVGIYRGNAFGLRPSLFSSKMDCAFKHSRDRQNNNCKSIVESSVDPGWKYMVVVQKKKEDDANNNKGDGNNDEKEVKVEKNEE